MLQLGSKRNDLALQVNNFGGSFLVNGVRGSNFTWCLIFSFNRLLHRWNRSLGRLFIGWYHRTWHSTWSLWSSENLMRVIPHKVSSAWCWLLSTAWICGVWSYSMKEFWLVWICPPFKVRMLRRWFVRWTSCIYCSIELSLQLTCRAISFRWSVWDKWHSELPSSKWVWILNWMRISFCRAYFMIVLSCPVLELTHHLLGISFFAPMTWLPWLMLVSLYVRNHEVLFISKMYLSLKTSKINFKFYFLFILLWLYLLLWCFPW